MAETENEAVELDLAELRRIAEGAQGLGRPWTWAQGQALDADQWCLCPGIMLVDGNSGTPGGDELDRAYAAHIVAFQPKAALSLLSSLAEARAERDAAHEAHDRLLARCRAPIDLGRLFPLAELAAGHSSDDEDVSFDAQVGREFIRQRYALREAISQAIDAANAANADAVAAESRASVLQAVLDDVCNPLAVLQRQAHAKGARLSGEAYNIANSLAFVKSIARYALTLCNPQASPDGRGIRATRTQDVTDGGEGG